MKAILLVFALGAVEASPPSSSGLQLLERCDSQGTPEQIACLSYINGVIDGLRMMQVVAAQATPAGKEVFCPPENATVAQFKLVVLKYLKDNPKDLDLEEGALVSAALLGAYRCR